MSVQTINLGALEPGQQKQMIDEYNAKEQAAEECVATVFVANPF
jgi:hypothetical protein